MQTTTRRLTVRAPFAAGALLDFLAYHLVPGVETAGAGWYARTLELAGGPGVVQVEATDDEPVLATFRLTDSADLDDAVRRTRWLLDVDGAPPEALAHLDADPLLAPLVAARPGLRVPGQVDGAETAVRTVIGQQISVTGARTVAGRIVAEHGIPVATGVPGLTHLFPTATALAAADPATLPMPRARGRAVVALATALADGAIDLDRDRVGPYDGPVAAATRTGLLALPGIGAWTTDYVAMRALGDPDRFLPTDLGVRTAITRLGGDPVDVLTRSATWAPWRSLALMHLWATLMPPVPAVRPGGLEVAR